MGEEGGEATGEEGGEATGEEGGEAPAEEGGATEEGGEVATEGGEETALLWSELESALQADCAPCHFGGSQDLFTAGYVTANYDYMIQRIANGEMPLFGSASPDLIPTIEAWVDGGFQQ